MSKKLIVVTPVTAKVEIVEVVSLTVAELVVLINNSKKVELTAEQVAGCKSSMAAICQKFVTGEKITADENVIMQFVAGLTKKAVHAGQTEVEKAEAKIQAEATFAADVQKYEIDLALRFEIWSNGFSATHSIKNETDSNLSFTKISKDALKTSFADFLKSLPVGPKKPGATKKEGSGNKGPKNEKSAASQIVSVLSENLEGMTKDELSAKVEVLCPNVSLASIKWVIQRSAKDGKIELKDGKLFAAEKVA